MIELLPTDIDSSRGHSPAVDVVQRAPHSHRAHHVILAPRGHAVQPSMCIQIWNTDGKKRQTHGETEMSAKTCDCPKSHRKQVCTQQTRLLTCYLLILPPKRAVSSYLTFPICRPDCPHCALSVCHRITVLTASRPARLLFVSPQMCTGMTMSSSSRQVA